MRWHKPPSGFMKCNIDAAIFKEARKTGVAAIIPDSNGDFMISRMHNCYGILEVREAEAKALLDAILWVVSLDLQNVLFETDSKLVVDAIASNLADRSEFGSIVAACCSLLYQEPSYEVRFARRQANMAAHTLARAANSSASLFISYDSPAFISDILFQDCRNSDLN
ncbi:uncharacterized protein [Primulina eburnea]|uniref:uncharacterized protein n=1 Tax=Primulina eburnea TaxID=1245227 RepID=UPI003C6C0678